MDTRLKTDTSSKAGTFRYARSLFAVSIVPALCFIIYYLIDNLWNGAFVEWFEKNYMLIQNEYLPETGQYALTYSPVWPKLKSMLLAIFILTVTLWLLSVLVTSHLYARDKVRKSITETSRILRTYMMTDAETTEIFPKEYAELSVQMAEIKSTMQRHEQILKEEAARKNDLITYLAHDLKTPLTSVIGYLSLLDEASDMPGSQKEKYVRITLDKAQRLEKLTNEFFEITRYNLQQIALEKETIDLCYMLVQMTDEFYPLLTSHGNTAHLNVREDMTIYGDALKLARVFNNILKNAIAYSYPDTAIEIWAEERAEETLIFFRNKGKTIPAQKLESIFEKFFRLDEARTTNAGGAGLGLAIAKEIVTLHGGDIAVESRDELTTFCLSLPSCH
ncbi:sensor histidine kinase [Extibacter muris]|uniref:histidine kinase n=1 Tax=Extibacter muris TaxID=1796622 RepID=A0A4R4FHQ6_9FIRM|nr:HAMP domain-containing sensor histidine kinase [Extibacter muris]MCU0079215.1 HAMP domain-containing histidine kinase [Extibacter muris]TDA23252.1 HAMP domain-containing histidine kinase [Extibacter muris]